MLIIKDQQITQDTWHYLDDNSPLCEGNITVSLAKWQADRENLLKHAGKLGLRLESDQLFEPIVDDLHHFQLIVLNFAVFTDGRGFSQAWLLRNRYQFKGEIRAIGHFMQDQLFYLHRVGVNSFKLAEQNDLENTAALLRDFSVCYQQSSSAPLS